MCFGSETPASDPALAFGVFLRKTLPQAWACSSRCELLGTILIAVMRLAHIQHKKERLLLAEQPLFFTPDAIRTHDLLLRRQSLYPAELRGHDAVA